ncbi:MAG: mechanosensitive ion channel domain-containing protein [Candidatus Velthaea sp.]
MIQSLLRHDLTQAQHDGLLAVIIIVLALAVGIVVHRVAFGILTRLASKRELTFGMIVRRLNRPAAYILPLLAVLAIVPALQLPAAWVSRVEHLTVILTIATAAWGMVALVMLGADYTKGYGGKPREDDLRFRQIETRVNILSRVAVTIVVIVATATSLMTFPAVRAIGATLLASAGLAGLAVGLATRPLLENLVAGIQIALTQPIRIDDVVIVEKEFGRVEEITSTYVVVALWDRRRMILPLTYFIDKPFETWTRHTTDLIGVVMLYTDYTMPVDALRSELDRVLVETPLWDGDVKAVQVTDTNMHGIEVRILVSARNAPTLFDLRCFVREKLIAFVGERYPSALPAMRIEAPALMERAKDARAIAEALGRPGA